jgi:hypothetical protein
MRLISNAFAHHFKGFGNDDKGMGVDFANHFLEAISKIGDHIWGLAG